jgi:hypothetical protein
MPLDEKDIATVSELMAKLLADQQEAIKKMVSEQANGAVTKGLKSIREKLELVPTKEEAAELANQRIAQVEEERKQKSSAAGKDPKELEIEELRRRLDASDKKAQKDAMERKETEDKARRQEERSATQAALTKAGVMPHLIRPAVAGLFESGAIARDKDGGIVFKHKGEFGEELLDLDSGIGAYLKTDEGMSMLPPKETGGSNDTKTPKKGAGGGKAPEMTLELAAQVLSNYTGG